jgi:hypothetical protein
MTACLWTESRTSPPSPHFPTMEFAMASSRLSTTHRGCAW